MANEEFERKKTMKFRRRQGADPDSASFEEEPFAQDPPGEAPEDEAFELNKTGTFRRVEPRRSEPE